MELNNDLFSIFMEGHSRGVSRHISGTWAKQQQNPAFDYEIVEVSLGEFKSVYRWLCLKRGTTPNTHLLDIATSRDKEEDFERDRTGKPSIHALGNTVFSMYDRGHDADFYRETLQHGFSFFK